MVTPAQWKVLRPCPLMPLEEALRLPGGPSCQGAQGNFEDPHYRRAGEEADHPQCTLSDVV
jgi:hypothetical protein